MSWKEKRMNNDKQENQSPPQELTPDAVLNVEQTLRAWAFARQHGAVVVSQVFANGVAILQFPPNVLELLNLPIYPGVPS
jgi:hypothetical protein